MKKKVFSITPFHAISDCIFKKYAICKGRASRGEFFSYFCFFICFFSAWVALIMEFIHIFGDINLIDFVLLYIPFVLAPPLIAVIIRRFHDCNKTGWLSLLLFIPIINIFGFYLLCRPGSLGDNAYGPHPVLVRF